jgi:pyrroline-5-carboxylate reductase
MAQAYDLGFIGGGNMAEGIVAAVIGARLYMPDKLIVADPVPERRQALSSRYGVATTADNLEVVRGARRLVLAVKPQSFQAVAGEIAPHVRGEQLLISIMAGLSTGRIEGLIPGVRARLVRVMPNLAIHVKAGTAGLCAGVHATAEDVAETKAIFAAGGGAVVLDSEDLIDAVTAVSGSGPAYFYFFVEAMVAGGVACGLTAEQALQLAEQTCLGAARMMLETGEPPAELRRKVSSKGGTTLAALEHMESAGVSAAIRGAVEAAFKRARELSA